MTKINELFSTPKPYDHPRLRSWQSWRKNGTARKSYIEFRRERDGLMFRPAKLYFTVEKTDETEYSDAESWDESFNDALIENGFKARSPENESERFGYMLMARMQPHARKFGDGFFNAVLIAYFKKNGYSTAHPRIDEMLPSIHTNTPEPGESVTNCEEQIDNVFHRCASQLKDKLGYSAEEGQKILLDAVAYYLDERFSVTNRKMLGW